jgi:hypothetical protein
LQALNTTLLRSEEVIWADFWTQMASTLASNPRFEDYVLPDRIVGVMFLRAYRNVTTNQNVFLH